ncbi:hypothetical protein [Paraburkholderia sp. MM5477-R1]|uniref:hypothetical protein n=1 Tax=Paraburkholderia sp. MM5477-R1 TaxID=2991062 RepID=UPI003D1C1DED
MLIGGYDLLQLVTSYGQVGRRGGLVYFDRYRAKVVDSSGALIRNEKDIEDFGEGIRKLQARWPLASHPDFYAARELLLEATIGIFGLLKEFMVNVLEMHLENGGKWNKTFIRNCLKDAHAIKTIRKEVEEGEEKLVEMGYGHVALSEENVSKLAEQMSSSTPVE